MEREGRIEKKKKMSMPSSFETISSSQVLITDLPELKLKPSWAPPPTSPSVTPSIGCDDKGFTLAT